MTIVTSYDRPPIPVRCCDWSAVTDSYDGAPDSSNRGQIGYGETEQEAIESLMSLLADEEDA